MSEILATQDAGVLTLSFNRPEKMNALTRAMYADLAKGLNDAAGDFGIRAVVLTAEGDHFTAGNDIMDFMNNPPTSDDSEMLLHCDVVIAGTTSNFSMPFASLGLVPEAGSSFLFPQLVGYQRAARIFMTGESFDADSAIEMGLAAAKDSDPLAHVMKIAHHIAEQPPQAIINTKALLKAKNHDAIAAIMKAEFEIFAMALQSDEAMEAFMKFMSKKGK
jgi:enoyl-CoA hydratase/carnithine racemase